MEDRWGGTQDEKIRQILQIWAEWAARASWNLHGASRYSTFDCTFEICMTNGEKNVSKKENFCTILSKLKLEHRDMKNSIKNYNISVGDQIQIRMTECLYSYQP